MSENSILSEKELPSHYLYEANVTAARITKIQPVADGSYLLIHDGGSISVTQQWALKNLEAVNKDEPNGYYVIGHGPVATFWNTEMFLDSHVFLYRK